MAARASASAVELASSSGELAVKGVTGLLFAGQALGRRIRCNTTEEPQTMHLARHLPASLAVLFDLSTCLVAADPGDDSPPKLPGACPVIEAIQHASLQEALDAVPPEGGMVRLPAGTFEIRKPLVLIRGDVRVEGAGTATHIRNLNTNGQPALILQHPAGRDVRDEDRLWRIMLGNFRITGNPRSGPGIEAIRIQEVFLQGVSVSEHGGHGVLLDHCYEDPRVSDCLITYNHGSGLHLEGCHDIVVSANQFEENQDALVCRDGFNLCMTGNNLDDHLRHGVVIENTYGSIVSANMIEECVGAAIVLDRDCYGNTLAANVIAHNGQGIVLRDAHGCAVSANTFTINRTDALSIGPRSGRITVTGNNFSNSYIGEGQVKRGTDDLAAAGIRLNGTRDLAIAGNLFSAVQPQAVVVDAPESRRVLFSNNVLTDVRQDDPRLPESKAEHNLPSRE